MRKKSNRQKIYYFSDKLKKQLAQIPAYPLTIVDAPSGFGKTTAIREYLDMIISENACQHWYTCLGEPTSSAWIGVCELLANANGEIAATLKKLGLPASETLLCIAAALKDFWCTTETYLVIDNYHLVDCYIPNELINAFSMHRCPYLHIIFITQQLETKQLFTFHNANIYRIDSSAFFFDKDGTELLFRMEGICLTERELESVYTSTEGWVSAIRLQITNYQENGSFNYTLGIQYLVETAIWNRLTGEEKNFLVSISVMDSFTAQQAAMILGEEILPDNIEDLLRSSDFIRYYPDKGIFVIHNILQEFLRNRFYHHQSKRFQSRVLRRAGASFAAAEEYDSAAFIFYKERDFESLLAMPSTGEYLTNQKEKHRLLIEILVETCPEETLIKYPFKLLLYAYQVFVLDKRETYQKLCSLISYVIQHNPELSRDELRILRGEYIFLRACTEFHNITKRIEGYKEAWTILGRPSIMITANSPCPCGYSMLNLFWRKSGMLEHSHWQLAESARFYRKLTGGHMRGADSVIQAEAMLMQGKAEEAEVLCYKALYAARSHQQVGIYLCAELILARAAILRGDVDSYFTAVRNIQSYTKDNSKLYVLRTAELCLTFISLVLGNTEDVANWFCSMESIERVLQAPAISSARMLYAKILLFKKRNNEFYGFSRHVIEIEKNESYLMTQIYTLIFLALAKHRDKKKREAQEYLRQALTIALPDKIYLPFAEQMGELNSLLEAAKSYVTDRSQLSKLLEVCKRQETGCNVIIKSILAYKSPLTPREREVALLAKARLSSKEIANRLYISEATVKTILRNVYSKLDVHSKTELSSKNF